MANKLRIGPNFTLPQEAVTETFGILAKRGVGKTHTAVVMVEELLTASLPVVVCDPVGVWWGLRSSKDGKKPGYPIYVFGGEHGDLPLEQTAGKLLADTILEQRIPVVLDLSLFRKAEQTRFMTDFAERLYQKCREPLHLVLDEADAFAPQRPQKGQERMLGAVEDLVRRGRARGIGVTLITQRAAVINKDVLTQIEVLVALRMPSPQDRKAAEEWIRAHGTEDERKVFMASLASLPIGTAWFWSPGWLGVFQKVKVRDRQTFDSSATPKVGARRIEPKKLSTVDIERIRGEMEKLSAQPAGKKKASAKRAAAAPTGKQLEQARREGYEAGLERGKEIGWIEAGKEIHRLCTEIGNANAQITKTLEGRVDVPATVPLTDTEDEKNARASRAVSRVKTNTKGPSHLRKGAVRILEELVMRYPSGYSKPQVGTLTRFSHKGGTFNTYLSDLRRSGFIEERNGLIFASEHGVQHLGEDLPSPKTAADIMEMWQQALRKGAASMLEVIVEHPGGIGKEDLAAAVEMAPTGGTFNTYLSDLRRNGLIEDSGAFYKPADILFPSAMS